LQKAMGLRYPQLAGRSKPRSRRGFLDRDGGAGDATCIAVAAAGEESMGETVGRQKRGLKEGGKQQMRRGEGSTSSPAIACRRLYIARLGLRRRRWSCGRNFEEGRTTNAVGCSGSGFSSSFGFVWFAPRTPGAWLLRLDCAARRVRLAVGSIMDGCRDTKTKGATQVFKFCFSLKERLLGSVS
jgi:hypothetical protein